MIGCANFGIDVSDDSIFINNIRNTIGIVCLPERDRSVKERHFPVHVAKQRKGKTGAAFERQVVCRRIRADAEQCHVLGLKLPGSILEPPSFENSTGCLSPNEPPEYDALSAVLPQGVDISTFILDGEMGGFRTGLKEPSRLS